MSLPDHSPPPPGVNEGTWYKNRLQQFTQRASMPLPQYHTTSEGSPHAPVFKCQVWVDGTCFTAPNTCSTRKMAEQEAAKVALIGTHEKVKNEVSSRVSEDTLFCKSIIYEYAVKMNHPLPTYDTNQSASTFPVFVSSLVLNGVTYTGDAGKTKKEAEQFAARSAILSILGSESTTTMSEIVKSKFKMYDALKKDKEPETKSLIDINVSSEIVAENVSSGVVSLETPVLVEKRKEVDASGGMASTVVVSQTPSTEVGLPEPTLGQPSIMQAMGGQSLHEFKKPRLEPSATIVPPNEHVSTIELLKQLKSKMATSSETIPPPIEFVRPTSEQTVVCSTSGKKQNRKKRKAKKKMEQQSQSAMVSQSAC